MLCELDENSFVPKVIQNNLVLPVKAFAQTSVNTLREPVGNMLSSFQKTYADELAKSEREYLHLHLHYITFIIKLYKSFHSNCRHCKFLHRLRGK